MIPFWFFGAEVGVTIEVDAGSFALTGQDVDLVIGYVIEVDSGSFTLTGQDLVTHFSIVVDSGSFILTGGRPLLWAGWPTAPDYNTDYGLSRSEQVLSDAGTVAGVLMEHTAIECVTWAMKSIEQVLLCQLETELEDGPAEGTAHTAMHLTGTTQVVCERTHVEEIVSGQLTVELSTETGAGVEDYVFAR